MQLVLASLLPLLCASFAPLPSRPSRRVVLSASIDDEEVARVLARLAPDTASKLFEKSDGSKSRFIGLERFTKRFGELGDGAKPAPETTDALWRAIGGYAPQRVIVKPKNFFEILAENVMGNPDQYNSVQKDVWGNPAKNPEGQSLSEKEVAAELAKIGTDRAGVAAALESGLDAMASKARLLAAKNAAAVSGYDF